MKIRQIVLAGATVMMLTTGNVWAVVAPVTSTVPLPYAKAPEIDAASGTSAIALLTGVLLLVGERSRSRRS